MTRKTFLCTAAFAAFFALTAVAPASAKIEGTCNSVVGCKSLIRACNKIDGKYQGSTSKGTCLTSNTQNTGQTAGAGVQIKAPSGPVRDAFCNGKTLCTALKQVCPNSGGVYKPLPGGKGVCKDK